MLSANEEMVLFDLGIEHRTVPARHGSIGG
jgi:hypothetical protein